MKVRRIEVEREFNVVCEFMSPGRELPEPLTPSIQKYLINCRDEDGVAGKIFLLECVGNIVLYQMKQKKIFK